MKCQKPLKFSVFPKCKHTRIIPFQDFLSFQWLKRTIDGIHLWDHRLVLKFPDFPWFRSRFLGHDNTVHHNIFAWKKAAWTSDISTVHFSFDAILHIEYFKCFTGQSGAIQLHFTFFETHYHESGLYFCHLFLVWKSLDSMTVCQLK